MAKMMTIWKYLKINDTTFVGLQKMKEEPFAFYCEGIIARFYISRLFKAHEICDTMKIVFPDNGVVGVLMNKLSPFRERFSINFLWMVETGIVHKVKTHWLGKRVYCQSKNHFEQVGMRYVAILLLFLLFSYLLSLMIFFMEVYLNKVLKV